MGALSGLTDGGYRHVLRPLLFSMSAEPAHGMMMRALGLLDNLPLLARAMGDHVPMPVTAGGVALPAPVMVGAGLVKGQGFTDERQALEAARHTNLLPGWRSIPLMCGTVEMGSFTRFPRMGNPSPVLWRDVPTRSTQNRIGLRNPGALAAAEFLNRRQLVGMFGISIATTPGESDPAVQAVHVSESIAAFARRGVTPAWFTVNLSCPNTEDDPQAAQTERLAAQVSAAAVSAAGDVPVWVKIGPDLADDQYQALIEAFGGAGVRAVIATNTLAAPVAGQPFTAGLAGGRLFDRALAVVLKLFALRERHGYHFDIIGCGGVMDGEALRVYADAGAQAVQVWSALVYEGPLALRNILRGYGQLR